MASKTHSVTVIAAVALAVNRFIAQSGAYATSSNDVLGVSEIAAAAGRACSCITAYSWPVEAAEAIAEGDWVKPAGDGSGRAAVGSANDACGRAISAAAAGALVDVRLMLQYGVRSPGGAAANDWVPIAGGAMLTGEIGKVYSCSAARQILLTDIGVEDDSISAAWNDGSGDVEFVADVGNGVSIVPAGIKKLSGRAGQFMVATRTNVAKQWRVIGADPTVGLFIDVGTYADWPALQAAFPNDGLGLLNLPKGTSAWVEEFVAGTGIGGRVYRSKNGTHWTSPHAIILFQSAVLTGRDVVYAAAGATAPSAVASASSGTKTRVTMAAHGLTAANDGCSVPVTAGTNWTPGLYPYTYVDANTIDLTVPWNAAFGNPTITIATGASLVTTIHSPGSIPAAMRRANSVTRIESQWQLTNNANTKQFSIRQEANDIASGNVASQGGASDLRIIRQRNSLTSSIAQSAGSGTAYSGSTPISLGADAGVARAINFGADLRAGNDFMRIAGYTISVEIGP